MSNNDATDFLVYSRLLNQIKTDLANVSSVILADERSKRAGNVTLEELASGAEVILKKQEQDLEEMYERVLGENGIVATLNEMKIPDSGVET